MEPQTFFNAIIVLQMRFTSVYNNDRVSVVKGHPSASKSIYSCSQQIILLSNNSWWLIKYCPSTWYNQTLIKINEGKFV